MLIDTHTHLDFSDFDADREAVLRWATEAGVTRMIAIGTNLDTSRTALALADRHPEVYATIGIHPNEVMEAPDDAVSQLENLAQITLQSLTEFESTGTCAHCVRL